MYIESLDQEMAIASQEEAVDFQNRQRRHWNIVSITGRLYQNKPHFSHALTVCSLYFDDVEEDFPDKNLYAAKIEDIQKAIVFSRELGQQPLLIHCYAGTSRSTALAWLILFDKMSVWTAFMKIIGRKPERKPPGPGPGDSFGFTSPAFIPDGAPESSLCQGV